MVKSVDLMYNREYHAGRLLIDLIDSTQVVSRDFHRVAVRDHYADSIWLSVVFPLRLALQ